MGLVGAATGVGAPEIRFRNEVSDYNFADTRAKMQSDARSQCKRSPLLMKNLKA